MKKAYINPSISTAQIILEHNINVNSIQGDGVGYGGGGDPSTGRVKGRNFEGVEVLNEMINDEVSNEDIIW